jgi:hypothetical protein
MDQPGYDLHPLAGVVALGVLLAIMALARR